MPVEAVKNLAQVYLDIPAMPFILLRERQEALFLPCHFRFFRFRYIYKVEANIYQRKGGRRMGYG